jgi:hypothetical protein
MYLILYIRFIINVKLQHNIFETKASYRHMVKKTYDKSILYIIKHIKLILKKTVVKF